MNTTLLQRREYRAAMKRCPRSGSNPFFAPETHEELSELKMSYSMRARKRSAPHGDAPSYRAYGAIFALNHLGVEATVTAKKGYRLVGMLDAAGVHNV